MNPSVVRGKITSETPAPALTDPGRGPTTEEWNVTNDTDPRAVTNITEYVKCRRCARGGWHPAEKCTAPQNVHYGVPPEVIDEIHAETQRGKLPGETYRMWTSRLRRPLDRWNAAQAGAGK